MVPHIEILRKVIVPFSYLFLECKFKKDFVEETYRVHFPREVYEAMQTQTFYIQNLVLSQQMSKLHKSNDTIVSIHN